MCSVLVCAVFPVDPQLSGQEIPDEDNSCRKNLCDRLQQVRIHSKNVHKQIHQQQVKPKADRADQKHQKNLFSFLLLISRLLERERPAQEPVRRGGKNERQNRCQQIGHIQQVFQQ